MTPLFSLSPVLNPAKLRLVAHYLDKTHFRWHCKQWLVCQVSWLWRSKSFNGDKNNILGFGAV
jgi:hypothetical protein